MTVEWSAEIPFTPKAIENQVPDKAGVYQILQSVEYPRYEGKTRVLEIGKSDSNLKDEISNHFVRLLVRHGLLLRQLWRRDVLAPLSHPLRYYSRSR